MEARGHHTNTIQRLKVDFSRQKEEFQSDAKKIIQTLEKKANKVGKLILISSHGWLHYVTKHIASIRYKFIL